MADIAPGASYAEALKEIAKVIYLSFSGKNRQMLLNVNRQKKMQKALNTAEEIFNITDKLNIQDKDYYTLRKRFDKNE